VGQRTKHVFINIIWSGVERFSFILIQLISTLVIARFITPSDFGLVSILLIFNTIGYAFVESGFGQALIREKHVDEIDFNSVFYFNILVSVIVYSILFLSSPLIASFFSQPKLELISKIVFISIPIYSLGIVHQTIMVRESKFKNLSLVSILASGFSGLIAIICAYILKNYWAIVIQVISYSFLRLLFFFIFSRWKPQFIFSWVRVNKLFPFSINLLLTTIIGVFFDNLYSLIIGKFYSSSVLGNYSQARRMQQLPTATITSMLLTVFYPLFADMQYESAKLKEVFLKSLSIILYIISPLMCFLAISADYLFPLLLTDKWSGAILFFKILCITGIFYPIHIFNINLLKAIGESKAYLIIEVINKVIMMFFLLFAYKLDIISLVVSQVIYYVVVVIFLDLSFCGKKVGINFLDQLKVIMPVVFASISSVVITYILMLNIKFFSNLISTLMVFIFGSFIYYGISIIFKLESRLHLISVIKNLKN